MQRPWAKARLLRLQEPSTSYNKTPSRHKVIRQMPKPHPTSPRAWVSHRQTIRSCLLFILVALFILLVDNSTYWTRTLTIFAAHPASIAIFGGIAFAIILFSLSLASLPFSFSSYPSAVLIFFSAYLILAKSPFSLSFLPESSCLASARCCSTRLSSCPLMAMTF